MSPRMHLSLLACFLAFNFAGGMMEFHGGEAFMMESGDIPTQGGSYIDPYSSHASQRDMFPPSQGQQRRPSAPTRRYVQRVSYRSSFPNGRRTTRRMVIRDGSNLDVSDFINNMMSRFAGRGNFEYRISVQRTPVTSTRLRQPGSFTRGAVQDRINHFTRPLVQNVRGSFTRPTSPPARVLGHGGPVQYGLNKAHIQKILDAHNHERRIVGAADMYEMWDTQLASEANDWIQICEMRHQSGGRGENLAMQYGYGVDISSVVQSGLTGWAEEKHKWTYGKDFSPATGHYTQMIWSSTTNVGCAAKQCGSTFYFFCFYSPPGNIMTMNPYTEGIPCSACQGSCKRGLCI